MTRFIRFTTESGDFLVEVNGGDNDYAGVVKAGAGARARSAVAEAKTAFDEAVGGLVRASATPIVEAALGLPHPPSTVEISFGLKATGEVGNFAIAKAGGEANYSVVLTWSLI